ncbi:MAG TPA: gamma carbonic anhydrase family protein [Steroidobacteraceae bacterium]|nr:gamma carbonic anhydrase family protein [Steroidobacteraceae bacterium]
MSIAGQVWPYCGVVPQIDATAFIAPGTHVIGDVRIGAEASIWFNCVVRGDVHSIEIGSRTNLQDGTIVHVTGGRWGTFIGDDVLVGHQCLLHGCRIENESFIGMDATVMDGCVLERGAMLGAGSLLPPGKIIESGELWVGRPARYVRRLTAAEIDANRASVAHYVQLAKEYNGSSSAPGAR